MAVSTLDYDTPLSSVLESNTVSLTKTKADPLTEAHAPAFEAFQNKLLALIMQETQLSVDVYIAMARIAVIDDALDDDVDVVSRLALNETGGNKTLPLYVLFFEDKRPSDIKRPQLGSQLERVRGWVPLLKGLSSPALSALAPAIEARVTKADNAVTALKDAKRAQKEFRTIGPRKAAIDEFNALRKSTYGAIAELPHKYPEKNLPNNYAERFFRHEEARKGDKESEASLGSTSIAGLILEQEAKLAGLKVRHEEAIAREDADDKAKAKEEAAKIELENAEKEAQTAITKVSALKAKLKK
jgi:hypothetical protein